MMIKTIDINDKKIAYEVLSVSLRSYAVEARIIDYPELPPLMETLESLMASGKMFYGYFLGEKLVGAIEIQERENKIRICRLVVDPDFFKRGIASALVSLVTQRAKVISVGTAAQNYPAIALYKKMGFRYESTKQVGVPAINWVVYNRAPIPTVTVVRPFTIFTCTCWRGVRWPGLRVNGQSVYSISGAANWH